MDQTIEYYLDGQLVTIGPCLRGNFKTMPLFVAELMKRGEVTAGVILVPQKIAIRRAIEDLELVIACHSQEEFRDRIQRLTL